MLQSVDTLLPNHFKNSNIYSAAVRLDFGLSLEKLDQLLHRKFMLHYGEKLLNNLLIYQVLTLILVIFNRMKLNLCFILPPMISS